MEKFFQKGEQQFSLRQLLRRIFLEDWLTKVIALFITVALWLGVTGLRAPTTERLRDISLKPRVSDTFEATDISVQEVDLLVTGDKRKIDQIKQENLIVVLDLTDVQAGDRTIQITPDNVSVELPTGIRLEEVQPNKIAVKLETVTEREIAVKVETEGTVPENFEIYSKTVAPQKVRVRGPESFIRSLDSIPTEKVSLENRREDFTAQRIPLNIADSKVTVLDTNVVDIAFRIGEKRIERLFTVPVQTPAEKKTATVILYGGRTLLESLKAENLRVELVKNDAGETSLNLILPPDMQDKFEVRKLKIN